MIGYFHRRVPTLVLAACLVWLPAALASAAEVLHYSFDNAGNLAADSSGNGFNGTINGPLSATPGMFGGGANFTGSAWIQTPLSAANFPSGQASLSVWLKDNVNGSNDGFSNFGTGSNSHYTWGGGNDGYFNEFRTSRFDNVQYESGSTPNPDFTQWHHLAITNDPTNLVNGYKVYFDGELKGQTAPTAFNLGLARLGQNQVPQGYEGSMDEFRLFNQVLTPLQIENLFDFNQIEAVPEPSALLAWLVTGGLAAGVFILRRNWARRA